MKSIWLGGAIAAVGLWVGVSAVNALAEEGAAPPVALELPDVTVAKAPEHCRCQGDLGASGARIRQVLSQPLKSSGLDFKEEPLEDVVDFLQSEYDIPIQIDEPALEDAGLTRDEHVSINVRNVSLDSALRLLLKQKLLTYVILNEVLIITTAEQAESELIVCIYDVRDLIGRNQDNKNLNEILDMIVSCVATKTWARNGGGEAEIKALEPGLLAISQTQAVHHEIVGVLSIIRETMRQPVSESHAPTYGQMREMSMGMEGMGGAGMGEMSGGMGMADAPESQPEPTPAGDSFK